VTKLARFLIPHDELPLSPFYFHLIPFIPVYSHFSFPPQYSWLLTFSCSLPLLPFTPSCSFLFFTLLGLLFNSVFYNLLSFPPIYSYYPHLLPFTPVTPAYSHYSWLFPFIPIFFSFTLFTRIDSHLIQFAPIHAHLLPLLPFNPVTHLTPIYSRLPPFTPIYSSLILLLLFTPFTEVYIHLLP
jgi:hypothetical protein